MQNDLTDEEIDAMFESSYDDGGPLAPPSAPSTALAPAPVQPEPVPLYSLDVLQSMGSPQSGEDAQRGVLMRKYAGVPGWAWGLLGIGVVGSGYMFYASRKKSSSSDDSGDEAPKPNLGDVLSRAFTANGGEDSSRGGWQPSRSSFAESLERYFAKKGMSEHVTVWVDADDAKQKGGLKFVSPLVNVQVKSGGVKVDEALRRHCRREGLNPVQHQDGSIGLYPHSSKRGKEWEEYIDALRDEGQSV